MKDVWGNSISFSSERKEHLLEHPEMRDQLDKVPETLLAPDTVVQSRSESTVRLFHRLYSSVGAIGDKQLCIVVKYTETTAFIITAFFTDKVKRGEVLWKK